MRHCNLNEFLFFYVLTRGTKTGRSSQERREGRMSTVADCKSNVLKVFLKKVFIQPVFEIPAVGPVVGID